METPVPTPNANAAGQGHGRPLAERLAMTRHVLKIDAMLFVGIMFLALLGVGITSSQGANADAYWRYMLILMALATTLWGEWRSRRLGATQGSRLLYQQMILWGAALVSMAVIYLLLGQGRLTYGTTGLLVLLVLAFATFVDGMLVSWKLYVVGLLLFLTLLLTTLVERYLWLIMLLAAVMVALVLILVMWKLHHAETNG